MAQHPDRRGTKGRFGVCKIQNEPDAGGVTFRTWAGAHGEGPGASRTGRAGKGGGGEGMGDVWVKRVSNFYLQIILRRFIMGLFDKKPKCPYCGSKKIFCEEKGFHFKPHMLITGVLGATIEAIKGKQLQWHCEKCDETFEIGAEE
jgi:hypothetical protein